VTSITKRPPPERQGYDRTIVSRLAAPDAWHPAPRRPV